MKDPKLNEFNLAGGTALALYLGHRKSIDLDLFSQKSFDAKELEKHLVDNYNFKSDYLHNNTLKGEINGVKVDLITHDYSNVRGIKNDSGVRLYSMDDVSAMKLSAIADSGTRLKDFVDVSYLSTKMSLNDMLKAYETKYPNSNSMRPVKGLTYYSDINFKEPIQLFNGKLDWKQVDNRLQSMIKSPDRTFATYPRMSQGHDDNSRNRGFKR